MLLCTTVNSENITWALPELLVLEAAFKGEPTEVPSPGAAAFTGFAAQAKPVRFVSARVSALHTPSVLVLIQGTQGIGV